MCFGMKCAGFLAFFSLGGIAFMLVMGALFRNESVGLLDDLPPLVLPKNASIADRQTAISQLYRDNASNCFMAAAAYAVVCVAATVNLFCAMRRNHRDIRL